MGLTGTGDVTLNLFFYRLFLLFFLNVDLSALRVMGIFNLIGFNPFRETLTQRVAS